MAAFSLTALGAVVVGTASGTAALASANRDTDRSQVVTADRQSGFTLYADAAAGREFSALVTGNSDRSVILKGAQQLLTDPVRPARQIVAEIQSLSDSIPESGAIDRLLGGIDRLARGNDAVNMSQVNALGRDPQFNGLSYGQVGDVLAERRALYIERALGKAEADEFRAAVAASPALQEFFDTDGKAIIALRDGSGSLSNPQQLIGLPLASGVATAAVSSPAEVVVTGDPTLGDAVARTLVRTQSYLNSLEEENATLKRIVEIGISLGKGPVGALGSYALDQAVSDVMKRTGLDQKAAQMAVGLGSNGLAILSTSNRVEEEAHAAQEPSEATTLTQAGVTILGVGSVAKALNKTPSAKVTVEQEIPDAILEPTSPSGLPAPSATGSARRLEAGVVSHDGSLPRIDAGQTWLRGTDGNAGRVPAQIAEKLNGRSFRNFREFRSEFWKAAASDPVLSAQFSPSNRTLMSQGLAPFVVPNQRLGKNRRYELDHNQPVAKGGNIYDLNNIIVRTPLNHLKGK